MQELGWPDQQPSFIEFIQLEFFRGGLPRRLLIRRVHTAALARSRMITHTGGLSDRTAFLRIALTVQMLGFMQASGWSQPTSSAPSASALPRLVAASGYCAGDYCSVATRKSSYDSPCSPAK